MNIIKKVVLLLFLAVCAAKVVEKHYHYHFSGSNSLVGKKALKHDFGD